MAGLIATCDGGGELVDPPVPTSITVTPSAVMLEALGDTAVLSARVLDQHGAEVSGAGVSWASSDDAVATVSGSGVVTAVGNGTAVVTARAGDAAGQAQVTIGQRVASVVVTPASLMFDALGDTISLVAEARDANGAVVAGATVSWSSGDESVATVSGTGMVTAIGNGTAVVTASAGGISGEAQVAVGQRVASVVVMPESLIFDALGDTASLVAEARDANGAVVAGAAVSWSSGNNPVATVRSNGLVTAVGNGTAVVTATAEGVTGQSRVAVQQRIASVVVTPNPLRLVALGDTARLAAEAQDANGTVVSGTAVSWSSANQSVVTVNADGLVTAVGNGTAAVTASTGVVSGQAQAVVGQRIASVVVTPDPLRFDALGDTAHMAARVLDANGAVVAGATVSWTSGNGSVATVSGTGLVTALGNGAAVITASAESVTGQAQVLVEQRVASVIVTPDPLRLPVPGDKDLLVAEARDSNGALVAGAVASWASNDESVATVSRTGLVTAVGDGTTVVTASTGGGAGQAQVIVRQRIASVTVTPDSLRFDALGDTARLTAQVLDEDGAVVSDAVVSWSSGNEAVATVSGRGLVTASGNGTAVVTASAGGVTGQAQVAVEQRVASVVVTPDPLRLSALGATASLTAEARDPNGSAVSDASASWSSGNESVATVSGSGLVAAVTAAGNGTALVTASVEGVAGQAEVVVEQRVASVVVTPDSLRFDAAGDTASLAAEARDSHGTVVAGAAVSWSSNDESVATVSGAGLVTAAGTGATVVTASAGGVSGRAPVVVGQRITSVVVTPDSLSFSALGDTASLVAEARDSNGAVVAGATVSWSSGNDSVATVSDTGLVTAAGNGAAVVTASVEGVTGEARVAVEQRITSVVVTPDSLTFSALGDTASLTAEALDSNGSVVASASVSWSSDNDSVATVSSTGLVTAIGTGATVVTASAGGVSGRARVVVGQRITSVVVTPDSLSFPALGDTASLTAEALDSNGAVVAGATVSWSSGNDSVATVSDTGLVTAAGNGAAVVTASVEGVTGEARVAVEQRVTTVAVTPDSLAFSALGDTASLIAEARDSNGALVAGVSLSWSSGNDSVATVTSAGLVTAVAAGTTTVTASAEGHQGSASIVVNAAQHPDRAALEALYNATNGPAWKDNTDWLSDEPIHNWYGVGTDANGRVNALYLDRNGLMGTIPEELGNLSKLHTLMMSYNSLTGAIPTELSNLSRLQVLYVTSNDLTGSIPAELGDMALEWLSLAENDLTGPIPPDLGSISTLRFVHVGRNVLTGDIPADLGNLSRLESLHMDGNRLTGSIPPELGDLSSLKTMHLDGNRLTGSIPPELGNLSALRDLQLDRNTLSGTMPDEMTSLVNLNMLSVDSEVCAPRTPDFESWLNGLNRHNVVYCHTVDESSAFLMQVVPPRNYVVPLVAGEPALLRVFVTANNPDSVGMPPLRATFYAGGTSVYTAEIPAQPTVPIPASVIESDWVRTFNVEIPGTTVTSGLEMVVEIDPDSTLGSSVNITRRIPETGRTSLDVRTVDVFALTVVPFLLTSGPDSTLLNLTSELGPDHELFGLTRKLLPIAGMEVTVHDPVWTSSISSSVLLNLVRATRVAEGGTGYWMGMLRGESGGRAVVGGQVSFAVTNDASVAHELGHNLSLGHAPCEVPDPDPAYPYSDGRIGVWGWKPGTVNLVRPSTPDLMSYCGPPDWISDYYYSQAFLHRVGPSPTLNSPVLEADQQTLLVWGGAEADGGVFLNPAFVVDAPPSVPETGGEYRVVGEAEDGGVLFSLDFGMPEIADGNGGSGFAFALPVEPSWAETLARITLTGGGRSAVLGRESDEAAALLRDPVSGQVQGLLLAAPVGTEAQAEWLTALRTENLDVQISRGIPAAGAWRK